MPIAKSVEDTVLGEALAGDYADILGVVSVIDNRSKQLGVSYQDVVAAKGQFDAYGKAMPAGVSKYRGLVDKAIAEVQEKGPVHSATFYATPAAAKGLPKGLAFETKTAGHQYYSDPKGRAIGTAQGYKTPDPTAMATPQGLTDVAGQPAGTMYDVAEAAPSIATPSDQMGLLADFSKAPAAQAQTAGLLSDVAAARSVSPSVAAPSLTGTTAYGFPTYAPTVDLEDRALSPVRGVEDYNPGAGRSLNPTTGVIEATQQAVTRSFGPGYSVGVFSGQEPRGLAAVNSTANHPGGYAIDFDVIDPMGNPVDVKDPQTAAAMRGVHTSLAATGRGIGYGQGYMAPGRTHVGTPPGSPVVGWGWDETRKSMEPGLYSDLSKAKTTGVSLPSFGPEVGRRSADPFSSVLGDVATLSQPSQFSPEYSPTAASEPGLTDPSIAAPVGPSYNIDQAGLTAPGFTGPAARSVSTQSIGPGGLLSQAAPSGTSYGPAGQTPAGFAELGAIGKTGRVGVAAPAPESILGPIAMPTQQPYFAPVAPRAPTAPAMVAPVAPVAPQQATSQQASAPSPSMASAGDVWGGRAQTGRATNGNTVSRNPDGSVSMTSSKYGYTEVDGQYRGKVDPSTVGRVGIAGPLSGQGITGKAPGQTTARSGLGQGMRSVGGSIAGGMVGGLLGPVGGIIGAYLGRQAAQGKNPFSGLLGRSQFSDFAGMAMPTPAAAQRSFQQGFTPGLGFPDAPNGPASQGGLSAYGEAASRGDFGGQAQSAADNPGKGLY